MSGHLAQILGDVMEDEFSNLLEKLAYRIIQRRNIAPPLDFICDFLRRPLDGSQGPSLRTPWFSPAGKTAFSVKEGALRKKDVTELKKACQSARRSSRQHLKRLSGAVLVTNEVLPLFKIDRIRGDGIYCWDMRRLLFYSIKARLANSEAHRAVEYPLKLFEEASCLVRPGRATSARIRLNVDIFFDDHHCNLTSNDVADVLRETYGVSLASIARRIPYSVAAKLSLHVLGMVDPALARKSYEEFKQEMSHKGITLDDVSNFLVCQYRPSAWSAALF